MYLSELTALSGVSGNEQAVRAYICERLHGHCEKIEIDSMGNVMAFKSGTTQTNRTLMLCAHMDEVGLIVSRITEEGFLKFKTVGGIDPRVLVSKRVYVGQNALPGVIGRKAIHLLTAEERKKAPKVKDLLIDIGAADMAEAETLVSVGDYVTFDSDFVEFGEGRIKAKALDDRVGCAVLLQLLEKECAVDRWFVFTVQEETGLRGARLCARRIKPDLAVVLEGTTCSDLPGTEDKMTSTRLGGGAAISLIDGATSYNRTLARWLYDLGQQKGIAVQFKKTATGGNDAGSIHTAAGGILTAAISVPARYIHSPSGVIAKDDYSAVLQLTEALLEEADYACTFTKTM